jgi:acylphosphatase
VKRLHAVVRGRVQGVGYRATAVHEARRRNLSGWVRNQPDGNVEVVVEGDEQTVLDFLEFLRRGPRGARVTGIDTDWAAARSDLQGFDIR